MARSHHITAIACTAAICAAIVGTHLHRQQSQVNTVDTVNQVIVHLDSLERETSDQIAAIQRSLAAIQRKDPPNLVLVEVALAEIATGLEKAHKQQKDTADAAWLIEKRLETLSKDLAAIEFNVGAIQRKLGY